MLLHAIQQNGHLLIGFVNADEDGGRNGGGLFQRALAYYGVNP